MPLGPQVAGAGRLTDVLVVGAGPVGLATAVELRRRGIACRIVDKQETFPVTSRANGLQARTLEVFDDMGAARRILDRVHLAHGVTVMRGGRPLVRLALPLDVGIRPDRPYWGVALINQAAVEEVLRERLAELGGAVERARELRGLRD